MRTEETGWLQRQLNTSATFVQGWNSALWEVHKMVGDGMTITRELLADLVRLSPRLSNGAQGADSERDWADLVPHTGVGGAAPDGQIHAQATTSGDDGSTKEPQAEAVNQAVRLTFEDGEVFNLRLAPVITGPLGISRYFSFDTDGSVRVLMPVMKIERVPA